MIDGAIDTGALFPVFRTVLAKIRGKVVPKPIFTARERQCI